MEGGMSEQIVNQIRSLLGHLTTDETVEVTRIAWNTLPTENQEELLTEFAKDCGAEIT